MKKPPEETAAAYIRENFAPADRLAVVLLNKRTGTVIQRLASADKIASSDFQAWLRHKNAERFEIYLSMNALRESAPGRTKTDVAVIRHVFLDFDQNGTAAVKRLLERKDLPAPNYLLNTSPDKWQAVWKVKGFTAQEAENLQRSLARETGADIAATDCARVLRLPGFYNHKYTQRHFIGVESLSQETCGPERFPKFAADKRLWAIARSGRAHSEANSPRTFSQSERDWAYARRALARGEPQDLVMAAIANHRRFEKHNPEYYAELTVRKAAQSLDEASRTPGESDKRRDTRSWEPGERSQPSR